MQEAAPGWAGHCCPAGPASCPRTSSLLYSIRWSIRRVYPPVHPPRVVPSSRIWAGVSGPIRPKRAPASGDAVGSKPLRVVEALASARVAGLAGDLLPRSARDSVAHRFSGWWLLPVAARPICFPSHGPWMNSRPKRQESAGDAGLAKMRTSFDASPSGAAQLSPARQCWESCVKTPSPLQGTAQAGRLLHVAPVLAHANLDHERDGKRINLFHFFPNQLTQTFHVSLRNLKHQFIVHLQGHA